MADGPGKYDHLATHVRTEAEALAVIVIVIDGNRGSGFSVQALAEISPNRLAEMLRELAAELEQPTS